MDSNKEFGLHTFPKLVLRLLEANPAGKWFTPLPLSPPAAQGTTIAPPSLPKNLTIRFGAHRASVYGASHAAKTAPFTAAAKDYVRESHARDLITKPVHPMILDEEFPAYQRLLGAIEKEVPPLTLPCLLPLGPFQATSFPASSGQKRRADPDQT